MRNLNNRQNKTQQSKPKRARSFHAKAGSKKPMGTKIGHHKKGPSRYPSM